MWALEAVSTECVLLSDHLKVKKLQVKPTVSREEEKARGQVHTMCSMVLTNSLSWKTGLSTQGHPETKPPVHWESVVTEGRSYGEPSLLSCFNCSLRKAPHHQAQAVLGEVACTFLCVPCMAAPLAASPQHCLCSSPITCSSPAL